MVEVVLRGNGTSSLDLAELDEIDTRAVVAVAVAVGRGRR